MKESLGALQPAPVVHNGGTYVCIEGPAFSTKAESRIFLKHTLTMFLYPLHKQTQLNHAWCALKEPAFFTKSRVFFENHTFTFNISQSLKAESPISLTLLTSAQSRVRLLRLFA